MSLTQWFRDFVGEERPSPPEILSAAEAVERAREYALTNGHPFRPPADVTLKRLQLKVESNATGRRWVYTFALGTSRPVPFVDVDAQTGEVLAWRSLPR
jgi:hypothetical protein